MSTPSRLGPAFAGGLAGAVIAAGTLLAAGALDDDDQPAAAPSAGIGAIAAPATGGAATAAQTVYERVGAGVVSIQARGGGAEARIPVPGQAPERRDDGDDGDDEGGDDDAISTGSGFVVDDDGTILTNAHVVGESDDVSVRFEEEGDLIDVEVVGTDASTDIAVLKVDPSEAPELVVLPLADSDSVRVGQPAVAIGNPFGLNRTATAGIVSGIGREIESPNGFEIDGIVQTDAPINPGNSGGPLLDTRGRVIGVNSQILTGGRGNNGNVGIGFAVPSNTVKEIVPQLQRNGKIPRAYLGVSTLELNEEVAERLDLEEGAGALVVTVAPGGPAAKAGVRGARPNGRGGDIITAIDGKAIPDPEAVAAAVTAKKPGDRIRIEVLRGERKRTLTATLGDRPTRTVG